MSVFPCFAPQRWAISCHLEHRRTRTVVAAPVESMALNTMSALMHAMRTGGNSRLDVSQVWLLARGLVVDGGMVFW
ncbi:MAG: hypothetical protein ACYDEV_05610 [Acidiferrobacter sp.]